MSDSDIAKTVASPKEIAGKMAGASRAAAETHTTALGTLLSLEAEVLPILDQEGDDFTGEQTRTMFHAVRSLRILLEQDPNSERAAALLDRVEDYLGVRRLRPPTRTAEAVQPQAGIKADDAPWAPKDLDEVADLLAANLVEPGQLGVLRAWARRHKAEREQHRRFDEAMVAMHSVVAYTPSIITAWGGRTLDRATDYDAEDVDNFLSAVKRLHDALFQEANS